MAKSQPGGGSDDRAGEPRPADLEGYDLADLPEITPARPAPPIFADAPPRRKRDGEPAGPAAVVTPSAVDETWSRLAEWGPNLLVVLAALAATVVLLWLTFDVDALGRTFFLAILGLGATLVLAYPIFITLERPVRVTPEQALQDYYDALSHWLPHHRRMWLLLSNAGRTSPDFNDFAGFRAYWKRTLASLKTRAGGSAPLSFRIVDYKADKSAGKEALLAKFTVKVSRSGAGGGEGDGKGEPIATIRDEMTLSRGPDRMWYLDRGTLPGVE